MNIAIDGPAGAGKSTIARRVAKELGSVYVDTGAMYRALALFVARKGIDPKEREAVEKVLGDIDITLTYPDGVQHVWLNGEDVTHELRQEAVTRTASVTAAYAKVREAMVAIQQKLAKKVPVVMDGRDICTVVLPDAEVKIFLTASPRTRAERRFLQTMEAQPEAVRSAMTEAEREKEISAIEQQIRERDERDMNREASPLVHAPDAVTIDSSDMTLEEVTDAILKLAEAAGNQRG